MKHIPAPFKIYNASAGSGKTFLLVQKYLTRLLSGRYDENFNRMMALTFTNKAVFEMKYRILLQLQAITTSTNALDKDPMGKLLLEALAITPLELKARAQRALKKILHDYAAFDVITLDSFTHRVIRTFAKDLGLAYNFDVALDVDGFLEIIVDRVLDRVGEDANLTGLLEQFTYEKMDDDGVSSWELRKNLIASARLLLNENDHGYIQQIARLTATERNAQQLFLAQKQHHLKKELEEGGKKMISYFHKHGLVADHFTRKTLYNRFLKLSKGSFEGFDNGKLYEDMLEGKPLYPKKTPAEVQQCIDRLSGDILTHFELCLGHFHQWQLVKDIRKQWIPLSLVTVLAQELNAYQNETNRVLLSTFNERIAKEILHQPTPYIYERLGENYRHYFLDEFQDTSSLQWKNLIPLIATPLESLNEDDRTGSLLLVGDPKQSIYRWRGGNVDQFVSLIKEENPFNVEKKVEELAVNYRSAKSIVNFNNVLYATLVEHLIYPENKHLFGKRAQQEIFSAFEGYVKLTLFEDEKDETLNPYAARIIEAIHGCIEKGYTTTDMVVLVRKKKQADQIAQALIEASIPTITSTSLKLKDNTSVGFLCSLLQLYLNPKDMKVKKEHLSFLYAVKARKEDRHDFLLRQLVRPLEVIWQEEEIPFDFSLFDHRDLHTVMEKACGIFPGISLNDLYVVTLMDLVFDFCQKEEATPRAFLDHWEAKKEEFSLVLPEEIEGVKILTIHQAKGLEFPIVFFPYADSLIHTNQKNKLWLSTQSLLGDSFPLAWVGYSKRILNYGKEGERSYHKKRQEEEMDSWNVFYVATTRAVEQLHLFASDTNIEKESYVKVLNALIPERNRQEEKQQIYEWGEDTACKKGEENTIKKQEVSEVEEQPSSYPYEEKLVLQLTRNERRESARLLGLRIHDLLQKIDYADMIQAVIDEASLQGEITIEEGKILSDLFNRLVQHTLLHHYYSREYKVMNEKAILIPGNGLLRPDRVGVGENDAVVIDYKTGKEKPVHKTQVQAYAKWIGEITGKKVHAFLVYLDYASNNHITVVELS
ncbi:MAG: UvrD-helicase domain-containing protein [Flavobacteriaceae bacterium]